MIRTLVLLLLFCGIPAFACPNLAGQYSCTQTDNLGGKQDFSLSITQDSNVFVFASNGAQGVIVNADGVDRPYSAAEGATVAENELTTITQCENSRLVMEVGGTVYMGANRSNPFLMLSRTVMKIDGATLTQEISTTSMGNELLTDVTCERS